MSARTYQFWITLAAALLVTCGCDRGGASPTGEGAPPGAVLSSAAAASVAAASSPATAATAGSQSSLGGGNGGGNSGGGNPGGGNSGGGNSGGGNSGGGNSGGGNSGGGNSGGGNSGGGNSGGGNSGGGNSGGGNSGGGNSGGGGAQGAPLQIPAVILHQGDILQDAYNAVVSNVTSACGGTQCVSVSTAGAGKECNFTVTVNGVTQVSPAPSTDSQGEQFDIVPRGASIVINGNADGTSDNPCPDNSGSSGGGSPSAQPSL